MMVSGENVPTVTAFNLPGSLAAAKAEMAGAVIVPGIMTAVKTAAKIVCGNEEAMATDVPVDGVVPTLLRPIALTMQFVGSDICEPFESRMA